MVQPLNYNDGILLISLIYSSIDLHFEWDKFNSCHRPIHQWLLVSYALVIVFRLMHLLGMQIMATATNRVADVDSHTDFLIHFRHKGALPQVLASLTWLIALPLFAAWTVIGTSWFRDVMRETPTCMPTQTHLWFSGCWLALCYVWIVIHVTLASVAWVRESRIRRAEASLREIEDPDVVSRWGQVSQLPGYDSLARNMNSGLTPSEIKALPCEVAVESDNEAGQAESNECSICLNAIESGDTIRNLPACGHTFHRSCIDLWLLRRSDCPLCKRSIRNDCGNHV